MLKKMMQAAEKYSRRLVVLFFALLFLYGCLAYDDYGLSADEPVQRRHSVVMYNDMVLKDQEYKTITIDTEKLPSYRTAYGTILQLPLVFIEHMNGFEMTYEEIYSMRHLYNFLWFFISVIFFYRLAMILTEGKRLEALLGTIIYVLCPRTLADSFYNIKDALCMALFTISMYYCVQLIRQLSVKNVLLFVLFSALCTTSRAVGGVVAAVGILVLFIKSMVEGTWKRLFKYCVLIGILFIGMFVVASPNAWNNIPAMLLQIIQSFSNYTNWNSDVVYMGKWISALHLPWHYLFVWIAMTVPAAYLLLMCVGLWTGGRYCIKEKNCWRGKEQSWIYLALLLILVIPFAYVLAVRPVLYNGWRHFYFVYPVIASWATIGAHAIWKSKVRIAVKRACGGILFAAIAYVAFWICKYHPYEYVYFNPWIKSYAADNFQRDYWFVSEIDAFRYILEVDDSSHISVYSNQGSTWLLDDEEGRNRLQSVTSRELADYVVTDEGSFETAYLFQKEKEIVVDDMVICTIYKRTFDTVKSFTLSVGQRQTEYELNGIVWRDESTFDRNVYIGELTERVPTDVLAVLASDEALVQEGNLELSMSYDGKEWFALNELPDYSVYIRRMSGGAIVHNIGYLKLSYDKEYTAEAEITVALCGYSANMSSLDLKINAVIESLESNVDTDAPVSAIVDGNMGTRWTTSHQRPGMWLDVALYDTYTISSVALCLGESPWDYPRNLLMYSSIDGQQWEQVEAITNDNEIYTFEPVQCRYLRFELGENGEDVVSNWSIYELKIFTRME